MKIYKSKWCVVRRQEGLGHCRVISSGFKTETAAYASIMERDPIQDPARPSGILMRRKAGFEDCATMSGKYILAHPNRFPEFLEGEITK
jgi:hypothetical protein